MSIVVTARQTSSDGTAFQPSRNHATGALAPRVTTLLASVQNPVPIVPAPASTVARIAPKAKRLTCFLTRNFVIRVRTATFLVRLALFLNMTIRLLPALISLLLRSSPVLHETEDLLRKTSVIPAQITKLPARN